MQLYGEELSASFMQLREQKLGPIAELNHLQVMIEELSKIMETGMVCSEIIKGIRHLRHDLVNPLTRLKLYGEPVSPEQREALRREVMDLGVVLDHLDSSRVNKYFGLDMKNGLLEAARVIEELQHRIGTESDDSAILSLRDALARSLQNIVGLTMQLAPG